MNKTISELGEIKLIERLLSKRDDKLSDINPQILASYHDDAAIELNTSTYTVISTDMLIEHSHFPKEMTHYQMGEKIVTVNVSDILSMNATPTSIVISMALNPSMTLQEFDDMIDGILHKCEEYGITLIGGDLNQNDEIILSATAMGKINKNIKLQSNTNNNDLIAITGELGSPAAGLDLLNSNEKIDIPNNEEQKIIKTILEPNLPIKESKYFQKYPELISSMTDITDGLAAELGHLREKNPELGFEIEFDKIPFNSYLPHVAKQFNKSLNYYLLHFGEEFELLLTINEKEYLKHEKELDDLIYIIGKVNTSKNLTLIKGNSIENIEARGYEHLK
ncbi:MAG: thiamine-phosphate kinase [Methanosphaera stadtmanae]|nr:thiamine-phosphate kinase [Methanosphaera stadtmanae]